MDTLQRHTKFPPLPVTEDGRLLCGVVIEIVRDGEGYQYISGEKGWRITSGPWCLGCGRQICVCPPPADPITFADTCCGKCAFGTCYIDQMTGA